MPFTNPKRRANRAFTLIELLVVVAIIALLIAILLPTLQRAKRQARQLQCATHMRSLKSAAMLYAADNRDYIPRGIQWERPEDEHNFGLEYAVFASVTLKYLGWDGKGRLWAPGVNVPVFTRLNNAVLETPQFQCPDYPVYEEQDPFLQPGDNPQHYVTSTFPMPYPQEAINEDAPYLEWDEDAEWMWEAAVGTYKGTSRIEDFPLEAQPARLIYITEVDKSVPWTPRRYSLRFYSMFRCSQLPFGGRPRIGEDQRHPAGLNAMFFDGHIETLDHHKMDPGYPMSLDLRLRYFTIMEDDWTP
jgi:prepilin-type N-terminal cleavage/methylation domain-containing protein/prepilin-type processing-associated H-X9-DG protein